MKLSAIIVAGTLAVAATPLQAQDAATPVPAAVATEATAAMATDANAQQCELHIWPTENYLGLNTGLLSGFGAIGAVADMAAHEGRVKTVKDHMKDYLGPDIQIEELNKADVLGKLKLANYKIVVEPANPSYDENKKNPEIKAYLKGLDAKIKSGDRLSTSKSTCYAELVTTNIFYHKAMMYGSNLFVGFVFRDFGDKPKATFKAAGAVKNPLEHFPPKTEADIDAAKAELRDAYSKDFLEYVEKKVKR